VSAIRAVVVGDRLPDLVRTVGLVDMVAYGAATWDWHRLHYDPEFAAAAGFAAPVVDGQMLGGLLAEQVLRAAGPDATLARLHYRNRAPVLAGEEIVVAATVVEAGPEGFVVEQRITVGDRVVVAPAGATVRHALLAPSPVRHDDAAT
jgi:acyl dehydratase